MPIKNAEQASEVVRQFLSKMGENLFSVRKAERSNDLWIVDFAVGFRNMRFEVDAMTGEILKYYLLPLPPFPP